MRDGSVYYDRASRNYYVIWYSKYSDYLRHSIEPRIKHVFQIPCRIDMYKPGQWRCRLSSISIYKSMRDEFDFPVSVGQSEWSTPTPIKNSKEKEKVAFIKGVFDAEGDVSLVNKYLEVSQKNTELLDWIKNTLSQFGIKTGRVVIADSRSKTHKIVIAEKKSIITYSKRVGFEHPEKEAKISQLIATLA